MSAPKEPSTATRGPGGDAAIARRKLLRAGAYVGPAILASLVSRSAFAQQASCAPVLCNPNNCTPGTPCGPATPCGPNVCGPTQCGPAK